MGLTAAGAAAVIVLIFLYGSWQLRMQAKAYEEAAAQETSETAPAEVEPAADRRQPGI